MKSLLFALLFVAPPAAASSPCERLLSRDAAAPAVGDAAACVQALIDDPARVESLGLGAGNALGASPRLGDLGFIVAYGRWPTAADDEITRMRAHLDLTLRILRARTTTPELTARRAHLLDILQAYRDKGSVPVNVARDRRVPVFIDEAGRICAVGHLIAETAGRDLAERVAARFRYDYLRDMDMPELTAWVASSGLSLEELALIQPAYSLPPLDEAWVTWVGPLRLGTRPPDGPFTLTDGWGRTTTGAWKKRHMDGHWERRDANGALVGSGDFVGGKGEWKGFNPDGTLAASGTIKRDAPDGAWRVFHASGQLAAEAHFDNGVRAGEWTYYFDAPGAVVMARGRYRHDEIGTWEHYDRLGRHIATVDTKKGLVTWYDATGAARAYEMQVAEMDVRRGDAVAWNDDGVVTRERVTFHSVLGSYDQVELSFDAAHHLSELIVRGYEDGAILRLADGTVKDAARRTHGPDFAAVDQMISIARTPELARFIAEAERGVHGRRKGATRKSLAALMRAAEPFFAQLATAPAAAGDPLTDLAARLLPRPFAPSFPSPGPAPALVASCPEDGERGRELCRYGETKAPDDPAGQVQFDVLEVPTMVTSGTNFLHLDVIGHRLMGFMVDRVPQMWSEAELPEWMQMPRYAGARDDTFGELSSSWAPLIGLR